MELRDDDAFWAARRVAAFTDDMIRAVVHTGEFSNPAAEKYLADVLIQRRDKIKSIYLTQVNPIVNPRLDAKGLTFENAAVAAGVAQGPVAYRASWMLFDNATGATKPLSETKSATTTIAAPSRPAVERLRRRRHRRRQRRPTRRGSSRCAPTSAVVSKVGRLSALNGYPRGARPPVRHNRRRADRADRAYPAAGAPVFNCLSYSAWSECPFDSAQHRQPSTVSCRVSEAMSTETMVTSAMAMMYDASAPRPYGSSAVAMNGESPPAMTDESCDPSDAPL